MSKKKCLDFMRCSRTEQKGKKYFSIIDR